MPYTMPLLSEGGNNNNNKNENPNVLTTIIHQAHHPTQPPHQQQPEKEDNNMVSHKSHKNPDMTVMMKQQEQQLQQPLAVAEHEIPDYIGDTTQATCSHWDDDHSGRIDRDYTGMFEGPEKTLEVVFRRVSDEHIDLHMGEVCAAPDHCATAAANSTAPQPQPPQQPIPRTGLRRLSRADLDRICERANCTILSSISNKYLDAHVLSESSLFIYPYMLVLKTCGTTTLLRCIATLIDLARSKLGLEIDWVGYSRKNFNFPGGQDFPHQSFHQELEYLYSHRNLCERLNGAGYTLGPVTGDHWFVFVADHTVRAKGLEIDTDRVLNIMMFDIDERVAKLFYYDQYQQQQQQQEGREEETKEEEGKRISKEQTVAAGIDTLCPGAIIDPRAFSPCGYSMNAILFRSYSTIHITPESSCSYASFETNQKVASYKALISNVIRTFRPKRFVMTLMADEGGLNQVKENPLQDSASQSKIVVTSGGMNNNNNHNHNNPTSSAAGGGGCGGVNNHNTRIVYKRSSLASIKVEDDCCCIMGNWVLETTRASEAAKDAEIRRPRGMTIS